jgi:hypothetical protein
MTGKLNFLLGEYYVVPTYIEEEIPAAQNNQSNNTQ